MNPEIFVDAVDTDALHPATCACSACHNRDDKDRDELADRGAGPNSEILMSDDVGGTQATSGIITPNGRITGTIETSGDTDWFAITLSENQSVEIRQTGIGLNDPLLRVRDANGRLLDQNDDIDLNNDNYDSQLTFTAPSAGTYYIEAGAFGRETGTYQVTTRVVETPTPEPYDPLEALIWGTQLADTNISVHFAGQGVRVDVDPSQGFSVTSQGFNAYEQARFQEAFDRIEAVTNVTFTVTDSASDADFLISLGTNTSLFGGLGIFNVPSSNGRGQLTGAYNGDAWDRSAGGDLEEGGVGFATITHELLHGLGLSHLHDNGGNSDVIDGVFGAFGSFGTHGLNQGVYSTMSYNGGLVTGASGTAPNSAGTLGGEAGPMALDIAALQSIYGANTTTALGNTVYRLADSNTTGGYWESIWDAGGTDELRYDGTRGATLDLRAATLEGNFGGGGYLSSANGVLGGFTVANGVMIENATGGAGADRLIGNGGNNRLDGGAGNDTLIGGGGADRLMAGEGRDSFDGGAGNDTVDYAASRGSLRVDLLFSQINTNIAAGDTYEDIENLSGSQGADNIRGTFGDNLLQGQRNVDYIFGRSGNDTLDGGVGNDVLFGGVGSDILQGGENRDRAQYSESLTAVVLDLMNTRLNTGEAIGDVYQSIEDLAGSAFDDQIYGNTGANQLFGREGADQLYGRGGDDYLNGGANNDRLDGGAGNDILRGGQSADTFVFNGGDDIIEDFNAAQGDRIAIDDNVITQVAGLNGGTIVSRFGDVVGGEVVFSFANGNTITIENINNLSGLADDIFVF